TALQLLADAGAVLAGTVDADAALQQVAQIVADRFADVCVIDALSPEGSVYRAALAGRHPSRRSALEGLAAASPVAEQGEGAVARKLEDRFDDPLLIALDRELGLRCRLSVPLRSAERTIGAVHIADGRPHSSIHLQTMTELARRASVAVE